jgi:exopolyphosphatase/guanosine-5'-triphosphate,3'-diphosphate pyrophosphatase
MLIRPSQLPEDKSPVNDALIGAIDVGSNAMRLGIAAQDSDGSPRFIQRYREPVRLGHDAFSCGILGQKTMDDAIEAFRQFRRILDQHHVETYQAIATSAMREARNGCELVSLILDETGIELKLISGEEEARLVHHSICHRVDLSDQFTLLVDMGGGSVEVTLCDDSEVVSVQSFRIGTVRLLEMLGHEEDFNALLSKYLDSMRKKLKEQISRRRTDLCIATGGNATAINDLARQLFIADSADQVSRKQLKKLIDKISPLSFEQRVRNLGLRPDRADVILPAAMIFHEIMVLAKTERLIVPNASLLDGILLDMVASEKNSFHSRRRNLLAWARSLKQKYHVDQQYADAVSALALSLFDQSHSLHQLGNRERLLLEIGARVHEIGMYVRVGSHHRHAAYLISVSPLLGLADSEKHLLAQLVRYQRKAYPCQKHEGFAALDKCDQQKVWHLSALLRLAIALNKERRNRVNSVHMEIGNKEVTLHPEGQGDLLLERWAILNTTDYFEQAFQRKMHIDLNLAG